jgi:mannose-6-phosphate isomerase-like protein (cupin superfamily)
MVEETKNRTNGTSTSLTGCSPALPGTCVPVYARQGSPALGNAPLWSEIGRRRVGDGRTVRRVVTGTGPSGQSTVTSDGPPAAELLELGFDEGRIGQMTSTSVADLPPPAALAPGEYAIGALWFIENVNDRHANKGQPDLHTTFADWSSQHGPNALSWISVVFGPDTATAMHCTDTIDLNLIVEGTVQLITEDGETRLAVGDCIVVPSVPHQWRSGARGCTMITCALGVPPNPDS